MFSLLAWYLFSEKTNPNHILVLTLPWTKHPTMFLILAFCRWRYCFWTNCCRSKCHITAFREFYLVRNQHDGLVVRVSASRSWGRGFEPRLSQTKDFKNVTYCLLVRHSAFKEWKREVEHTELPVDYSPYSSFHCIRQTCGLGLSKQR